MMTEWRSSFVRVNGIKTHYVEAGEGEPLILVHGGGPGASGEHGFRQNIPALSQHFRVFALDLIGYGLTEKPPIEYWEQPMAEHLAGFIDVLCLDKVRLLGNSMGAYVTAKYALDHPGRAVKLLFVSSATIATAMGIPRTETEGMRAMVAMRDEVTNEKMRRFLETLCHDRSGITDELVESRVQMARLPGAQESQRSHGAVRARLRTDPNLRQLFDLTHRLPAVTVPICLVWGKEDRFAPVDQAYALQKLLPNLRELHVLEKSGHQCQNDEVERFNQIALEFFRGDA
jgi:pimeloyl-ACP methyl ester carboxylesterase